MRFLRDLLIPYTGNNHKGHLIKSFSLVLLSVVFVGLQVFLNFFLITKPAVLGYSSNISPEKIIELTNTERGKLGLPPLQENTLLSEAARQKAGDMFAFNYWAHVSPSGRTPWTFFSDVGYKYQYAGENLARDFRDPDSVVRAWMNSSSHKENIVNEKYQEIGVAVVDGSLQGVETTLVIQLFGTPYGAVASNPQQTQPAPVKKQVAVETPKEVLSREADIKAKPISNPLDITKAMAIFVVGILLGAFVMDLILVSRQHTPRLSSGSMAQMLFLIFVLAASLILKEGAIL